MPAAKQAHEVQEEPATPEEAKQAIELYTRSVEKRIKPTLDSVCTLREKTLDELAQLEQMSKALNVIELQAKANTDEERKATVDESGAPLPAMETRVNIGEEFYVRANIYDLSRIIVDVGLGVLVEMTRPEARAFVDSKRKSLEGLAETYAKRITQIRTHLESVISYLSELEAVSGTSDIQDGGSLLPQA